MSVETKHGVRIYVIAEEGDSAVKVGVSEAANGRLAALQSCNPRQLRLFFVSKEFDRSEAMRIERAAHASLSASRIRGEWFDCDPYVATWTVTGLGGVPA